MDLAKYGLRPVRPEVIDSSMLRDYVDCPSKFYLRHVLGLRPKRLDPQSQAPLDWGSIWHRVMDVWSKTGSQVEALSQMEPWPTSVMGEIDTHGRSQERMVRIFFDYVEQFGAADEKEFEALRTEQFFDIMDPEIGLRWCGRIDKIERRKRTKRLQIRDYKTTSRMGSTFFEQFEYSFQLPGYVWAGSRFVTEPLEEVMLDVLYTLKGQHQFFRRTLRFPPERIAEWRKNVILWLNELEFMLDYYLEEPEQWKKSWNECTRYGLCPFSSVHFLPPTGDTRLRVLQNDYYEDRWDPRHLEDLSLNPKTEEI